MFVNDDHVIDTFPDSKTFFDAFCADPYDLVFLDIEMPGVNGITLARNIRERSENVYIVFLTAHIEYALEGYEVNALRYLTKPVDTVKLKEVIEYVHGKLNDDHHIVIKENGENILIDVNDIVYMESIDKNVRIVTRGGEYITRYNLGDFEEQLKDCRFFRIHRGYLISLSRVRKISKNDVVMDGGISLPVSRSNMKQLKDAFYAYIEGVAL